MKKIISLLAACTLFAVCLPVSATDAVTEDSAPLQTPLSNRLTHIHSISFRNEPMFLRKKYKLEMSAFQPKFTSRATPTQPNKSPGHAFVIKAIPAAFISPTAATFSAQRICTSNPTAAVLSSQNMSCRPASGKLLLLALTPLTAVHR